MDAENNPKVVAAKAARDAAWAASRAAHIALLENFTREGEARAKALRAAGAKADREYTAAFRAAGGETLNDRLLKAIFG